MAVIYALCDPETGEVRYVGKTSAKAAKRLAEHVRGAARGLDRQRHLYCWIRSLTKPPTVRILERNPSDLDVAERSWIKRLRLNGARLCNVTDGGDGWTAGMPQSVESNRRRSETQRRNGSTPEQLAGLKKATEAARSPEVRARAAVAISRATQGRTPPNKRIWTSSLRARALDLYSRMSAENAARELGIGRRQMFMFLRAEGVIRARHERVPT